MPLRVPRCPSGFFDVPWSPSVRFGFPHSPMGSLGVQAPLGSLGLPWSPSGSPEITRWLRNPWERNPSRSLGCPFVNLPCLSFNSGCLLGFLLGFLRLLQWIPPKAIPRSPSESLGIHRGPFLTSRGPSMSIDVPRGFPTSLGAPRYSERLEPPQGPFQLFRGPSMSLDVHRSPSILLGRDW